MCQMLSGKFEKQFECLWSIHVAFVPSYSCFLWHLH